MQISSLSRRLKLGWDPEYALTAPRQSAGRRPGKELEAFGEKKTAADWLRDPRCKVISAGTLKARLARGLSPEEALRRPAFAENRTRLRQKPRPKRP